MPAVLAAMMHGKEMKTFYRDSPGAACDAASVHFGIRIYSNENRHILVLYAVDNTYA